MKRNGRRKLLASENECLFCSRFWGCRTVKSFTKDCSRFDMDYDIKKYFGFGRGQKQTNKN
jgi:hypothetical protein